MSVTLEQLRTAELIHFCRNSDCAAPVGSMTDLDFHMKHGSLCTDCRIKNLLPRLQETDKETMDADEFLLKWYGMEAEEAKKWCLDHRFEKPCAGCEEEARHAQRDKGERDLHEADNRNYPDEDYRCCGGVYHHFGRCTG